MHLQVADLSSLIDRIKAEYCEMPGLSLTPAQAQRVWHLDERVCRAIFDLLLNSKFLTQTRRGAFVRAEPRG